MPMIDATCRIMDASRKPFTRVFPRLAITAFKDMLRIFKEGEAPDDMQKPQDQVCHNQLT